MITDTALKWLNGGALTAGEVEEVRMFFEKSQYTTDVVASWVKPNTKKLVRDSLASTPYLDTMIMRTAYNTPISIPNNVITITSWEEQRVAGFMRWDGTSGFYLPQNPGVIGMFGTFEFDINATGQRGIDVYYYDQVDTVIASTVMTQLPAQPTNFAEYPVAYGAVLNDMSIFAPQIPTKLKFGFYQNSGGALNLTFCQLAIFRMPNMQWV